MALIYVNLRINDPNSVHTVLCRARDITDMFSGLTSFVEKDIKKPWSCQALSKVRLKSASSSTSCVRFLSIIPTRGTVDAQCKVAYRLDDYQNFAYHNTK